MATIKGVFSADHRHCDELFSACEDQVSAHDWEQARQSCEAFVDAMRRHFAREEEVLFPLLVARHETAAGPRQVMEAEHEDMRHLMAELLDDVRQRDEQRFFGSSETLLIMMQQHNSKEENILYELADQVFGAEAAAVLERARTVDEG